MEDISRLKGAIEESLLKKEKVYFRLRNGLFYQDYTFNKYQMKLLLEEFNNLITLEFYNKDF